MHFAVTTLVAGHFFTYVIAFSGRCVCTSECRHFERAAFLHTELHSLAEAYVLYGVDSCSRTLFHIRNYIIWQMCMHFAVYT